MRFVLINNLMQSSRRLRNRVLSRLQPPPDDAQPTRKDLTGFIFVLTAILLVVAIFLMV